MIATIYTYIKASQIRFQLSSQDFQGSWFANAIRSNQAKNLSRSWDWQPVIMLEKIISYEIIYG